MYFARGSMRACETIVCKGCGPAKITFVKLSFLKKGLGSKRVEEFFCIFQIVIPTESPQQVFQGNFSLCNLEVKLPLVARTRPTSIHDTLSLIIISELCFLGVHWIVISSASVVFLSCTQQLVFYRCCLLAKIFVTSF